MTLTPTDVHESLDTASLLDTSHGPGTYALRVDTPDTVDGVARAFLAVGDSTPPDATIEQLTAERVAYVGASKDVYARLMDHARGDVRKATFLRAFDAVDVIDVWPDEAPFRAEFNRSVALSSEGWCCWVNGTVL